MRSLRLLRLVTPVVLAGSMLSSMATARARPPEPSSALSLSDRSGQAGAPVTCEGSWLVASVWSASPLPSSADERPPLTLHDVVRIEASGHTCSLPAGWLRLSSLRRRGYPYAAVRESDTGASASVALSPVEFAVAHVSFTVPWFIPSGNVCASSVWVGMTPPGSRHAFPAGILAGCGTGYIGVVKATVSSFRPVASGVPGAGGTLLTDLEPGPIAVGPNGTLYFSEPSRNQVFARLSDGRFELIAGSGRAGFSGDGGPAVKARLRQPEGLAVAPDGSLFIADFGNNRVREVLPDGTIKTVAGDGGPIATGEPRSGPALSTPLWSPWSLAIGRGRVLYVAETNGNAVAELHGGVLTTLVTAKDLGALYRVYHTDMCNPWAVALDNNGDLYFECEGENVLMRTAGGQIVYRGHWALALGPGFGEQVLGLSSSGFVSLTSTGAHTTKLPNVLAGLGMLDPMNIAGAPDGAIYLDQNGSRGGPPAIVVREPSSRLVTLWAADT